MSCQCSPVNKDGSSAGIDFQYAVKLVCGVIKPKQLNAPLPHGRYSTCINVHNPSRCDVVTLRWKVAVGLPGLQVGSVSDFAEATLGPDEALEIDCPDVMARLAHSGAKPAEFVKGWVIIETLAELDVVAVYGTAISVAEPVNAFHTERVQPRCLPVCDDFDLDISTGVAAWEVKVPGTSAVFAIATLSQPVGPWSAPPAGSLWVIPGSTQSEGDYTYRLSFKLCSGFKNPSLNLILLADYYANVFLNGHQIPPLQTISSGPNFNTPISFTANSHFKAGLNELTIIVHNTEKSSPTGLALHGSIEVANGRCSGDTYPLLACPSVCYNLYSRTFSMNPITGIVIDILQALEGPGCQGTRVGDMGGMRRAEQFGAFLTGAIPPGTSIEYRVFTRTLHPPSGPSKWSSLSPPWTSVGLAGTIGADHPITALEIRLINAPVNCHVRYRVATRPRLTSFAFPGQVEWSSYFYDGAMAGTDSAIGFFKQYPPIVAVEVIIL